MDKQKVAAIGTLGICAAFVLFTAFSLSKDTEDFSITVSERITPIIEQSDINDVNVDTGIVNINEADVEELVTLPGIGEVLAGRIIKYREENGDFSVPSDILDVEGIGEGKYMNIKDKICV